MKQILILILCVMSYACIGQTKVKTDQTGNYVPVTPTKIPPRDTGKLFIDDDGTKYKVYINSKQKLYIIRKSKKTGKEYKQYLTV